MVPVATPHHVFRRPTVPDRIHRTPSPFALAVAVQAVRCLGRAPRKDTCHECRPAELGRHRGKVGTDAVSRVVVGAYSRENLPAGHEATAETQLVASQLEVRGYLREQQDVAAQRSQKGPTPSGLVGGHVSRCDPHATHPSVRASVAHRADS
jgi:hypothetical protein